jgi:uncharacterized membrane protein YphA (DoxX/SURF4 family)
VKTRRWLVLILRVVLAAVFMYAAWSKLRQPWLLFAMAIDAYGLVPQWAVMTLARALPWFELALGILLLTGFWLRQTATVASALLVVFFAVMLRSYTKGLQIDCAWVGLGEAISLNTMLSAVVLAALAFRRAPYSAKPT